MAVRADGRLVRLDGRAEPGELSHHNGVTAERERLSRAIHDRLAQGFTSIVMLLEAADATLAVTRPRTGNNSGWLVPRPGRTSRNPGL